MESQCAFFAKRFFLEHFTKPNIEFFDGFKLVMTWNHKSLAFDGRALPPAGYFTSYSATVPQKVPAKLRVFAGNMADNRAVLSNSIDNREKVGIGNAHTQCMRDVTSGEMTAFRAQLEYE